MLRLPAEVPQTRVGYPAILADSTDPINSSPPHKPKSLILPKKTSSDHTPAQAGLAPRKRQCPLRHFLTILNVFSAN
jgi:hypothetical protein